jgi:hypothetical protein
MADATKANAAKEFFEKFGEKLALGVALLILCGYAVMAFAMSSEDPSLRAVETNIKAIEKEEKTPHQDMVAPPTENWQAKAINPWNTVVTSARSADDWSAFLVTKAEGKGIKREIQKKTPVIVPEVAWGNAEVAIDSITVTWIYKDFSREDIQKMAREKPENKKEMAKASHFLLERQVSGGKWEVIGDKLDVKVQSYVDTKIEPKTKYAYRVTAFSTDKAYLERGGAIDSETGAGPNPEGKINTATGPQISTLGIWKLTFTNPMKPAEAKGMVYVKIEKFEKGHGKVEKAHMQYDGDQIGSWEETQGAEPTTKHRVNVKGGRSIEVDFNTGTTLISVTRVNLPVEVKRCKPIYDKSSGNKIDCEKVIEKRNFDTGLVTYKDDEGVKKVYVPSPGSLDQLCEEHGGRKITTTLPPEKKENPDEPKVDPKEALKAKKEAEAEKLFEEAEKALEKNKALAKTLYTRLMSAEYKDTDFVAKNKKPIIEERLGLLNKTK